MKRTVALCFGFLLVLTACAPKPSPFDETNSSSSSSEMSSQSSDVTYGGVLTAADVTIGMPGMYILTMMDGTVIYLKSDIEDLSAYEGYEVELTGQMEQIGEGDVRVMNVLSLTPIALVNPSSESSSSESSSSEESSSSSEESSSSIAVSSSSKPAAASSKPAVSSVSSVAAVSSSSASSTSGASAEMQARIQKMAKDKGPSAWNQQYCSSHIGACFAVRSDYWYKSFGATTSVLWHVELSSEEIEVLGDGPLAVNLLSGNIDESKDGSIETAADGSLIGYRSWTDNRHFEVKGPVELRAAIQQITSNIVPYEPQASSSSL